MIPIKEEYNMTLVAYHVYVFKKDSFRLRNGLYRFQ